MTKKTEPIREYDTELDLAMNNSILIGVDDFYGRPLGPDHRMTPGMLIEALHPEDLKALLDALEAMTAMKQGETVEYRLRFIHTDGRVIQARYVSRPLSFTVDGRVRRIRSHVKWFEE